VSSATPRVWTSMEAPPHVIKLHALSLVRVMS